MTADPPSGAAPSSWKLPRLRITRDGDWTDDGEEVTHPGIIANLRDNLRVDDAGHYLQVGPARVPVEVDDAPYVVVRVAAEGGGLAVTLNDGSREPLEEDTLDFDPDGVPHCRVKGGRFGARLSRAAAYQLLEYVEEEASGERVTLVVGARRRSIPLPSARTP